MAKKYLIFILILGAVFVYFLNSKDTLLLKAISGLVHVRGQLRSLYLERLNFKLADDDAQIPTGYTEKYVLEDQTAKKWLCKIIRNREDEANTLITYRLASILGINTPVMSRFTLTINGVSKQGFIMEMLPPETRFCSPEDLIKEKKDDLMPSLLRNVVFGWWLSMQELGSVEQAITPSGEVYQIDLNNAFDCDHDSVQTLDNFDYTEGVKALKDIDVDFGQVHAFVKHSVDINDEWLKTYLNESSYGYGSNLYRDKAINEVMQKKKTLLQDYQRLFAFHAQFEKEELRDAATFFYRLSVCKALSEDVIRCAFKIFTSRDRDKQPDIEIIASGDTLNYLFDCFEVFTKPGFLKNMNSGKLLMQMENQLALLCCNCDDLKEKLAIELYLMQMRMFRQWHERYGYDSEEVEFFGPPWVPIAYNVSTFKNTFPKHIHRFAGWYEARGDVSGAILIQEELLLSAQKMDM